MRNMLHCLVLCISTLVSAPVATEMTDLENDRLKFKECMENSRQKITDHVAELRSCEKISEQTGVRKYA